MNKLQRILRIGGAFLLCAAVALAVFNLADAHRAGADADRVRTALIGHVQLAQGEREEEIAPTLPESEPVAVTVDEQSYIGVIELPRLNLSLPVASDWDYDALQDAPCRYAGSPYSDGFVICAHNYYSHFGRIGELNPGDIARFTDCEGRVYTYRVADAETLAPGEIARMTDSGYALTLFTCNWNGTARVTVRFDRVEES